MKRRIIAYICAAFLFLLPILATAASPGFTCDSCDYESSAAGQRVVTVAKDGGTVKVREFYCPNCKIVISSVEIPDSYQNSPAEVPVQILPVPSSNESQEANPPKPAEDTSSGIPSIPSGAGSSSAVVIPVSPAANDDTPKDPSSSGTQSSPAVVIVQPEQPAADAGASVVIVPEQPATPAVIINTGTTDASPAGLDNAPVVVTPEQPVTNPVTGNTGTADTGPAGSGDSVVIVSPELPVTNPVSANTGVQPPAGDVPIVLVPLDQPAASGGQTNTSSNGTPAEQPVTSRDASNQSGQQPTAKENTQAVTYVEPEPVKEREPVHVEPEYPVSPVDMNQQPSSGSSGAEVPLVLVTEKPPVSAEVPAAQQVPQPQLTAPPAPQVTLPPVIADQPTFTPPPTEPPKVTPTPKPRVSSNSVTDKYPPFSRFFPARRLHLKGDPEAQAPRAGILIWPEEPGMSLLERMLNADP